MRCKLKDLAGNSFGFIAHVARAGIRPSGYDGGKIKFTNTLVLADVERVDTGEKVANHIWIDERNTTATSDLHEGDLIRFDAFVYPYIKANYEQDYGLRRLTNLEVLKTNV